MKKISFKTLIGSAVIAGSLLSAPVAVFAQGATTTASVRINQDGIVRVIGAEVTSISGNIINAVTRFKNSLATWTFTTNASTTIVANNSLTASTTDIRIGDRLRVTGALTSLGSTIGVAATKVRDITSTANFRTRSGVVQSVSTSTGAFVMRSDDKLVTVQTNASTTFMLGSATSTLASVLVNSKVHVTGAVNSDGTFITASKVVLNGILGSSSGKKNNNGVLHGLKNGWKDKEDRDNPGKHKGFLNGNSGRNSNDGNDDDR